MSIGEQPGETGEAPGNTEAAAEPNAHSTRGRRSLLAKLTLSLVVTVVTLFLIEGGSHLVLRFLPEDAAPITAGTEGEWSELLKSMYRADDELFFRLRPSISIETTENPRIFDLKTNALGYRGAEIERSKPPGVYRILCIGDSCTFGSGAGDQKTWPAQLQSLLASRHPDRTIEVINAGVPGFTSYQGRRLLETEGWGLDPDLVLFAAGYNDQFNAHSGSKRSITAGTFMSDREYAEFLAASGPDWAFLRLLNRAMATAGSKPATLAEGSVEVQRRVSPRDFEVNLRSVAKASKDHATKTLFVLWPLASQAAAEPKKPKRNRYPKYQAVMRDVGQQKDVPVVDLIPAFKGEREHFIDAVHLTEEGYGLVARAVADALDIPD
jgi:lysophospholipase L1-like esterase